MANDREETYAQTQERVARERAADIEAGQAINNTHAYLCAQMGPNEGMSIEGYRNAFDNVFPDFLEMNRAARAYAHKHPEER